MHYLRPLLSNYRELVRASKLTGLSNKTLLCIKAKSEKVALVPRKPRSDVMKPCDFDKCEIYVNCKITHKHDSKFYIIIKTDLWFWVSNHYLFIRPTLQKDTTNVYVRPTDWATKPFRNPTWYINCFVIIIPLICIKPHVPLFSIVQSTINIIIELKYREWTVV